MAVSGPSARPFMTSIGKRTIEPGDADAVHGIMTSRIRRLSSHRVDSEVQARRKLVPFMVRTSTVTSSLPTHCSAAPSKSAGVGTGLGITGGTLLFALRRWYCCTTVFVASTLAVLRGVCGSGVAGTLALALTAAAAAVAAATTFEEIDFTTGFGFLRDGTRSRVAAFRGAFAGVVAGRPRVLVLGGMLLTTAAGDVVLRGLPRGRFATGVALVACFAGTCFAGVRGATVAAFSDTCDDSAAAALFVVFVEAFTGAVFGFDTAAGVASLGFERLLLRPQPR